MRLSFTHTTPIYELWIKKAINKLKLPYKNNVRKTAMNIPEEVVLSIKHNNADKSNKSEINNKNTSIFDNIINSYNNLNQEIENYKNKIKKLRLDADKLKEEIIIKKDIERSSENQELTNIEQVDKKIEINNYSINEETCNTVIDHINHIRSNISTNTKLANDSLQPLEESVNLLKIQVKYTVLLEDILELFKQKNKLENKKKEIDQTIELLANSLNVYSALEAKK